MPKQSTIEDIDGPAASRSQRVRDVMRRDFITIQSGESLLEALQVMRLARLRHLAVVNEGVLVGILSYRDLQDRLVAGSIGGSGPDPPAVARSGGRRMAAPFSIVPAPLSGRRPARSTAGGLPAGRRPGGGSGSWACSGDGPPARRLRL
jgi:CBS domain-containing protein